MDQRREPRFEADQAVEVTVLGGGEIKQIARVRNASGRGMALEMPGPIAPGTALKIELADALVLGEAVYCCSGQEYHLVGVELDQVLCSLTELGRKLQEFAGEYASGGEVAHALNDRNGKDGQ